MTDEEIMFDFFSVTKQIEIDEEQEEERTNATLFEVEPMAPGQSRSFGVRADKKEFERWFKQVMGREVSTYLSQ